MSRSIWGNVHRESSEINQFDDGFGLNRQTIQNGNFSDPLRGSGGNRPPLNSTRTDAISLSKAGFLPVNIVVLFSFVLFLIRYRHLHSFC
jgi:hypothetical protein